MAIRMLSVRLQNGNSERGIWLCLKDSIETTLVSRVLDRILDGWLKLASEFQGIGLFYWRFQSLIVDHCP